VCDTQLDAIGTKRFGGEQSGDREVQRTMLELLNQLDGFTNNTKIKVIAATNRPDVLDPALLRSGRLDRKVCYWLESLARRQWFSRSFGSDRVAAPDGGGARSHPADPLAQDERRHRR
jgi:ATP-dependent 26S proteasome regulatory subunit